MVFDAYSDFVAYLEALPTDVNTLDAAADAVSAAVRLPQLPTWLVRFVFALAVVFGLHVILLFATLVTLCVKSPFWICRVHEGMIVTNPRLIITVISIVLGTFLLVDFILQILIHYERIGYTNIYLFHELKWPWLYVLAWVYAHAVLVHLIRTGRLLAFDDDVELPPKTKIKIMMKATGLNASLIGITIGVPALQITLSILGNYHFNKAISLARELVPTLQIAALTVAPNAPFVTIQRFIGPAEQIFKEVAATTAFHRIEAINWAALILLFSVLFFPVFRLHLAQLHCLIRAAEVEPETMNGQTMNGETVEPAIRRHSIAPSVAEAPPRPAYLHRTTSSQSSAGRHSLDTSATHTTYQTHTTHPSTSSAYNGTHDPSASLIEQCPRPFAGQANAAVERRLSAGVGVGPRLTGPPAAAASKRIRFESLVLIVIVAVGYFLCAMFLPLAVWGSIVRTIHDRSIWIATYAYAGILYGAFVNLLAPLFCYLPAVNLYLERRSQSSAEGLRREDSSGWDAESEHDDGQRRDPAIRIPTIQSRQPYTVAMIHADKSARAAQSEVEKYERYAGHSKEMY